MMIRTKGLPRWLLVAVSTMFIAVSSTFAETRIALVTLSQEESILAAFELATVELSRDIEYILLEREEIQAILNEQTLSLQMGDLGERALALGHLLKSEVLVVCERSHQGETTRCVVFDTSTGCRLHDSDYLKTNSLEMAKQIVRSTQEAIMKRSKLQTDGLRFISFHGWRNVDLPNSQREMLVQIRTQIEQQFSSSPQLAVLERMHLGFANAENRLTTFHIRAQLLASAMHVVIQFESGKNHSEVKVNIIIHGSPTEKDLIFQSFVSNSAAPEAIQEIVEQISQAIPEQNARVSPVPKKSGTERLSYEAAELRTEGYRLHKLGELRDAIPFFEAAHALQPKQHGDLYTLHYLIKDYVSFLLKSLQRRYSDPPATSEEYRQVWHEALQWAEYRLDLVVLLHNRRKHEPKWLSTSNRLIRHAFWPRLRTTSYLPEITDEIEQKKKAYTERYRQLVVEELERYARETIVLPGHAVECIRAYVPKQTHVALTHRELQLLFERHDRWYALLLEKGWLNEREGRAKVGAVLMSRLCFEDKVMRVFKQHDREAIRQRIAKYAECDSPFIRLPAQLRLLVLDKSFWDLKDATEINERARAMIKGLILLAARPLPPDTKNWYHVQISTGEKFPGDSRRSGQLTLIRKTLAEMPEEALKEKAIRSTFSQLLKKGIFDLYLLHMTMPKTPWAGSEATADDLIKRVACYKQSLVQIATYQNSFPPEDYQRLTIYLTSTMLQDQSLLDKLRGTFRGVRPWSALELLEGEPRWPAEKKRKESPTIIGYQIQKRKLLYLTKTPQSSRNASQRGESNYILNVKQINLDDIHVPQVLNSFQVSGNRSNLAYDQYRSWSAIADADGSAPRRVQCDHRNMYWGRVGWGIVVLPLNGEKPYLMNEETGLPSNYVHAIAVAQGKLYACLGRPKKKTLLVVYDAESRKWETLISSERFIKKQPLDGDRAQLVRLMHYDQPRNRLIFCWGSVLWSWDLSRQKSAEVLDISRSGTVGTPRNGLQLQSVIAVPHRNALLINQGREFWAVDLEQDNFRRLPESKPPALYPRFSHPATWHGHQLWLRSPWGAYDYRNNLFRPFEPLILDVATPRHWHPFVEILDQGQHLIIWDRYHLWIAELNNDGRTPGEVEK